MHAVFYKLYFLDILDTMANILFLLTIIAFFVPNYNKSILLLIFFVSIALITIIPNRYLRYSQALIDHHKTLTKYEKQYIRNQIKKWNGCTK